MKLKSILVGLTLGLAFSVPLLQADDTEIYTGAGSPPGSNGPIIILNLDVRPNTTATTCTGEAACKSYLDEDPNVSDDLWDLLHPDAKNRIATGSGPDRRLRLLELYSVVMHKVMNELLSRNLSVQIGMMVNHANNNNCSPGDSACSNGGFVLEDVKPLTTAYATQIKNKLQYIATIDKVVDGGSDPTGRSGDASGHSFQGKELYFEMFRYLTGQAIYNGHLGDRSFDSHSSQKDENLDQDWPTASWDTAAEDGSGSYVSPLDPNDPCSKVYAINVLHQVSNQEDGSDSAIAAAKSSGGTGATRTTYPDMIQFMRDADLGNPSEFPGSPDVAGEQGLISYFLSRNVNTTTNGYAQAGGTGSAYNLALPPDELVDTITNIFLEILTVSTTFVAASIPVNAFNRATVTNNVFFALFQAETSPVWPGNLKRLRLTSNQVFVDANGNNAIASDGRIKSDALTFWTNANGVDVQTADPDEGEVVGKDGRSVRRGGSGQQIPGFLSTDPAVRGDPGDNNSDPGARKMFTEPASYTNGIPADPLLAFNADDTALTGDAQFQTDLGASSQAQAEEYMRWLRGYAIDDLDSNPSTTDMRPWFMADALHSRPVPVNYGNRSGYTDSNQDIRILLGTNDGFFRMFRNSDAGGDNSPPNGEEVWAFAPRDALGNTGTLRLNQLNVKHPYGVDGAPTVWIQDNNGDGTIKSTNPDLDTAYAYFGLRRGGKSYYALDISDPDDPKMLWSVDSSTGSDTEELGLTFSQPQIAQVQYKATPTQVFVVAGGYNGEDDTTDTNTKDHNRGTVGATADDRNDDEGNAIYILDATDGSLVWKATYADPASVTTTEFQHTELKDSIPAEVALVDTNNDQLADRLYVIDTAARLWRGDMPSSTTEIRNKWALTLLADFGRHESNTVANDRRSFHGVDVVRSSDADGSYYGVVIGTGDRANPKEITHDNKLIVVKDRKVFDASTGTISDTTGLPYELDDLGDITDNCLQVDPDNCAVTPDLSIGWFMTLSETGEKVLSSPLTVSGTIFFSTYLPNAGVASSACLPSEGGGRAYAVRLDNGGAAFNLDTSNDGDADVNQETGMGADDRFIQLNTPGIPPDPVLVPPVVDLDPPPDPDSCTEDLDGDGIANCNDDDIDGDGVLNDDDNCLVTANTDQADADGDGVGDACEDTSTACGALVGTTFIPAVCPSNPTFWYQIEDPINPN